MVGCVCADQSSVLDTLSIVDYEHLKQYNSYIIILMSIPYNQ